MMGNSISGRLIPIKDPALHISPMVGTEHQLSGTVIE